MKFVKNRYATNIVRNDYTKNPKRSTIETPMWLCNYIFEKVVDHLDSIKDCIDAGCWKGNLSLPFKNNKFKCLGYDNTKVKYHSAFIQEDFLNKTFPSAFKNKKKINKTVIVCNPPFNDKERKYGKKLIPELFLRKIFRMYGQKIPLIFFSPMGLLKNQKISSPRWKWIRDCGAKITSELELPIDAFIPDGNLNKYEKAIKKYKKTNLTNEKLFIEKEDELKRKYKITLVHSSVLFFNIKGLPAKMFLED